MEKYVVEPTRFTDIAASCDVLVAGAGIAGMARRSRREKRRQRHPARAGIRARGLATLGLVTIYLPLCDGEGRQLVFGLGKSF